MQYLVISASLFVVSLFSVYTRCNCFAGSGGTIACRCWCPEKKLLILQDMFIRICFCSFCGSVGALLHLQISLPDYYYLSFLKCCSPSWKLQQLLFQLEKAAFSRFIMSVQDPTQVVEKLWSWFAFTVQIARNLLSWFQENRWNCCHQMSDFKFKMHKNRFRLRLRPRPRWGSLQRSPRPPGWI